MGTIEDVANEQIEVANNTDQIPAGYKSPLLSRSGAAEAQGAAAQAGTEGVAWHYGSPLVEQRIFETGTGLVDRSNRKVIKVEGPDAPTFLNNILSQRLIPLKTALLPVPWIWMRRVVFNTQCR